MSEEEDHSSALVWVACSDPTTGRFRATEVNVSPAQVVDLFDSLGDVVGGYLEVRRSDDAYPVLAVSTLRGYCVVHQFIGQEEVALLDGDGSLDSPASVELPVLEERAVFTGDHVVSRDRARFVLEEFMAGGSEPLAVGWTVL